MSERHNYIEYTPEADISSLKRLNADFKLLQTPGDIDTAFLKYFSQEFQISEDSGVAAINKMREQGVVPSVKDVLNCEDVGVLMEHYRLAIFTGVLPLYQSLHSTNEFGGWLPFALETALPEQNYRHNIEDCRMTNGPMDLDCDCAYGTCPIKVTTGAIEDELVSSNLDSYDFTHDKIRAYRSRELLLEWIVKRGYINKATEMRLQDCFDNRYSQYFNPSQ